MDRPLKVLIVDDSALVRCTLTDVLEEDPEIRVIGAANDPYEAVEMMRTMAPDVLILDVEMPRMDGVTFLRRVMQQHPIPTVMCSTLVGEGTEIAIAALEAGAVDLIEKPTVGTRHFLEESCVRLWDAVKAAGQAKVHKLSPAPSRGEAVPGRPAVTTATPQVGSTDRVVVVGASTGGTQAVAQFLSELPLDCPGVVIVQHMPEGFTGAFARRLNTHLAIEVKEAETGDAVVPGRAIIAKGNHHLLLKRIGKQYSVEVKHGPLVSRHRPSVNALFRSAASAAGDNAIGVIMTGMGDDGATGMRELKDAGATTFAQDEQSCVVYGMPGEAVRRGGVDHILSLNALAGAVLAATGR